jgi:hypothetical protein
MEMLTEAVNATNSLEGFATYLSTFWTDQPFQTAVQGWNIIPLSREDLVNRARTLAERIKALADEQINAELKRKLTNLPGQIAWFQANTLPQLGSGNLPQVVNNFEALIANVEQTLPQVQAPSWEEVANSDLIPRELAKRIRSLEAALARLAPKTGDLEAKIQRINEAHAVAADLPTDLQSLEEARDEIAVFAEQAKEAISSVKQAESDAHASQKVVADQEATAKQLIANIDSAYSAATTAGLAASFLERAGQLSRSTWYWVALLLAALGVGGWLGSARLAALQTMINDKHVDPHWVWLNAAMSILSIAAPVWFAWLATRQIGQRFRLSEDYAFKASVARAYEGYRKEAARVDPQLEARLFASALDRLDEPPLRFLSVEEHGSPYEALLASTGFQKALEKFPNLRETAIAIVDRATAAATRPPPGPPAAPTAPAA